MRNKAWLSLEVILFIFYAFISFIGYLTLFTFFHPPKNAPRCATPAFSYLLMWTLLSLIILPFFFFIKARFSEATFYRKFSKVIIYLSLPGFLGSFVIWVVGGVRTFISS